MRLVRTKLKVHRSMPGDGDLILYDITRDLVRRFSSRQGQYVIGRRDLGGLWIGAVSNLWC